MTEPIHIPSLTDAQLDEVLLGANDLSRIVKTMALVEVVNRALKRQANETIAVVLG